MSTLPVKSEPPVLRRVIDTVYSDRGEARFKKALLERTTEMLQMPLDSKNVADQVHAALEVKDSFDAEKQGATVSKAGGVTINMQLNDIYGIPIHRPEVNEIKPGGKRFEGVQRIPHKGVKTSEMYARAVARLKKPPSKNPSGGRPKKIKSDGHP